MIEQNILNRLGLDTDLIIRDRDACVAAAQYYQEMRTVNENYAAFAATMFRRAASHALLVTEIGEERDSLFRATIEAYQRLKMPYAYMLSVFVGKTKNNLPENDDLSIDNESTSTSRVDQLFQQVYTLLASTDLERYQRLVQLRENIRENLEPYRRTPIGVLGIPIGHYLDLFDALIGNTSSRIHSLRIKEFETRVPSIEQTVQRFLRTYDEALQRVRTDRYHWQKLAFPFHPAELDIFAVLLYTHKAIGTAKETEGVMGFVQNRLLSDDTRLLLNGIIIDYI